MTFDFTTSTLSQTAKYDRELKLNYFIQQLESMKVVLGMTYDVKCNINAKRTYTFRAIAHHVDVDLMTMDLIYAVQ